MKKILFVLLLISFSFLQAQEALWLSPGIGLKVQSRLQANYENEGPADPTAVYTLRPIYPAIFFLSDKGHIHLVEVSNLDFDVFERVNVKWNNLHFSMAYEYSVPLTPIQSSPIWRPYLGIGLNHNFTRFWVNPNSTIEFKQRNINFRSDLYLQPSFIKVINERMYVDFAAQLHIGSFIGIRFVNEDPSAIRDTNFNEVRSTFLKQFGVKVGFGVKL